MTELQDLLPNSKKLSILIIDPDNELREKLASYLRKVYALVDDAANGYDGLSFCKINNYDIVIVDEKMPNMTTEQLIVNIHTTKSDQKIIYLSHEDSIEILNKLITLSVTAVVHKPFEMSDFYTELSRVSEIAYNKNQTQEQLIFAKKMKSEQKKLLENEFQKREKLISELAYERKRIGKLLGENAELSKQSGGSSEDIKKIKYFNDITKIENKYALQLALKGSATKAIIYLNIDHFDLINTLYGMGTGNKVLKATADRIAQYLPKNAKLYNVSVDEFIVLISEPTPDQEKILAEQVITMFEESPLEFDSQPFELSFSVGLVRGSGMQLFVQSKIASKEAKYYGGGTIATFDSKSHYMNKQREDLFWIKTLKSAIHENRILAYYQPIVNNADNSVDHFEVLSRLKDESGNIINADEFIKAAETVGLITKITRIMIDSSFKHFSTNSYKFSINICGYDLHEDYLLELLKYKCELYNIEPSRVYLELIGDSSINNSEILIQQMEKLRALGFHIGIDDINMDYSIFSRILRLNADFIKIDKSFVHGLTDNESHQHIISTIVEFAKKSGVKTVAEHVETIEELRMISKLGVDYSQGFYVGKPSEKSEIIRE